MSDKTEIAAEEIGLHNLKPAPGSRKAHEIIADSRFWRTQLARAVRAERNAARAAIQKATGGESCR